MEFSSKVKEMMNDWKTLRMFVSLIAVMVASSCALIPAYVSDPEVAIERVSTPTGRIMSADFWAYGTGVRLRGEVSPKPVSKSPLPGHIDIAITAPGAASTRCATTRHRNVARHVRKPYSIRFEALPPPGSVVRVWHHAGVSHDDCVS